MDIMSLLLSPEAWIAFFTLTALELVLGIDNIIFISILVDRLPRETREKARKLGLFMAMFMRIGLLLLLAWIVGATQPLFTVFGSPFSPRDLILIFGGLFLVWKATAVGMVKDVAVMIAAVIASVALMMLFARTIGDFVSNHPTIKMLALSFLLVVGVTLMAEGFGHAVPKGYIYFAMAFSLGVEVLNLRMRKKREPVRLHDVYRREDIDPSS